MDISEEEAGVLNATWNKKRKMWKVPNTIATIQELYPFVKDRELVKLWQKKKKNRDILLDLKQKKDIPGDERLRSYQRVDANYLMNIPHVGIFNQQRTGKTPTSLVLIKKREWTKNLLVVPASLCLQWQEEAKKWLGHEKVKVLTGLSKKKREDMYRAWQYWEEMTLIISYETALRDLKDLLGMEYDCVLLDEAHRLRSITKGTKGRSRQSEACFKLGKQAKHRLALTGTPTVKSGDEIWGILHFLYPKRFPGRWQFNERYFYVKQDFMGKWRIGEYKRQDELEEILTLISVNRKRKEVMSWLPEKQYKKIMLEPTTKQKKAYKDVSEMFEHEDKVDAPNVLVQLLRLRQITTGPKMLDIGNDGAKEKFILEWLEDNPNEPVVIFSMFTSYLNIIFQKLKEKKYKVGMITGEQTKNERQLAVQAFQDERTDILLCNIKAAGVGLTLDRAENVIFIDKEYNPTDNEQAEDRIIPVSKERNHSVNVISLVIKGTFDETLEWALKKKINIVEVVNNAGMEGLKRLQKESQ